MRCILALLLLVGTTLAETQLADLFGDNMVFQRRMPFLVWGTDEPGRKVTVEFNGESKIVKADEEGRWRVELGPFGTASGLTMIVEGSTRVETVNICMGEVWVCSGQSNMQWAVRASANAKEEIAAANDTRLRLFTVARRVAGEPLEDTKGRWVATTPESVANFSAVAYYFGRALRKDLGVPVGLIHTSWGGTPAEAWTRRAALAADPVLTPILERWDKYLEDWPKNQERFQAQVQKWNAAGKKGRRPRPPPGPQHPHRAAGLFNGMIAPLTAFPIRGAIWYQGESNAGRAEQYRTLFPTMIRDWRDAWGTEVPFLFVQLANFKAVQPEPGDSAWAELREAQALALKLPKTGMAVAIDIGEAGNIHPKNKQEVGRRLALAAAHVAYGRAAEHAGPALEEHKAGGGRIVLQFDQELQTRDAEPLKGFAIAGEDRVFRWANVQFDGKTVIASHPAVKTPVAVRYAWADNPECNLINAAGLPASPFRTDDWPGVTAGKR